LDRRHHVWKHRIKATDDMTIQFLGDQQKLEQGSTLLHEDHLEEVLQTISEEKGETDDDDLNNNGEACGSCYGAGEDGECCNTCDDVKRAYSRKGWHVQDPDAIDQCRKEKNSQEGEGEGCNVHGLVALDSGGGSFHLAPGRSSSLTDQSDIGRIFELLMRTFEQFNVTHTVHKIRFGDEFPGNKNQLDGETRVIADGYGMYQYYFKVGPEIENYK